MPDQSMPLSPKSQSEMKTPLCPVGERRCEVIDQVLSLRAEVAGLSEQIRIDPLTNLYNVRHLRSCLELEMERTRRTGHSTAIIMVDLDHFKKVNDNYGHEVGNKALLSTAEILQTSTRQLDICCRYGGEEFTVILPSTDLLTAVQVAERIREVIEQTPLLVDGEDIVLTASLGVDIFSYAQSDGVEQFIQRADNFLYQAKKNGRNQVCHGDTGLRSNTSVSKEERDLLAGFFDQNLQDNDE